MSKIIVVTDPATITQQLVEWLKQPTGTNLTILTRGLTQWTVRGTKPMNGNAIEFFAALLNMLVACSAQPMYEVKVGGQEFQIQSWVCQVDQGPVVVKAMRSSCETGHAWYWGRPYYLEFVDFHTSVYMNRFGEVMVGVGADISDAYQSPCGS